MRSWDCQVSVSQRILLSLQTLCSQVKVLCVFFLRSPLLEMAGDFLVTLFILKYELVKDEIFYRKVHYCFIKDRISYQNQLSKQLTVKWWSHPKRAWECKDHLLVSSPGIIVKFPPSHVLFTILILLIRFFFFFSSWKLLRKTEKIYQWNIWNIFWSIKTSVQQENYFQSFKLQYSVFKQYVKSSFWMTTLFLLLFQGL